MGETVARPALHAPWPDAAESRGRLPFLGLIRPRAVGRAAARRVSPGCCATGVCCTLLWPAIVVALVMWGDAVRVSYVPAQGGVTIERVVTVKPLAEVWRECHAQRGLGRSEQAYLALLVVWLLGIGLLTWTMLPLVHRQGSILLSLWASCRGVLAAGWLVCLLSAAVGLTVVSLLRSIQIAPSAQPGDVRVVPILASIGAGSWICIAWLERCLAGVGDMQPDPPPPPPRCEGCGYDLTHTPGDDRCPECGFSIARSLTPGRCRGNLPWEDGDVRGAVRFLLWIQTTLEVLFRPRHFYSRLCIRRPSPRAGVFSSIHLALFPLAAGTLALAILVAVWGITLQPAELLPVLGIALASSLMAWLMHRFVSAVALTGWFLRDRLRDGRWCTRVVPYETAFLWVCFTAFGVLFASLVVFPGWLSDLFPRATAAGRLWLPRELLSIMTVGLALGSAWIFRYLIIVRAIRWNNF
jgi:hypothetical protein